MNRDRGVSPGGAAGVVVGFIALAISIVAATPTTAQDADTQEIQRFTLTDAGLAKYTQATKKLAALPASKAACDDEDADAKSLDAMVAKMSATPGVNAAVQSAGMTTREYVVFSMSLFQNGVAAWAAKQPGGSLPPGISKANADFVNRHEAELKALQASSGAKDCDDDSRDE